jgi:RNA-directed DNA polymerase
MNQMGRPLGRPFFIIVSQSVNLTFNEIFDPEFTGSNFGFRKGKSQHQAIRHVQGIVNEGYSWCASIDLASFFDQIPHDLILKLIRRKIADERLITLVVRGLKAGVVVDGQFQKSSKGCPQGSPLSPMLSNIVLNELDHELEKRDHRYCRWADDFVILFRSERAAKRVMTGIVKHLEEELNHSGRARFYPAKKYVMVGVIGGGFHDKAAHSQPELPGGYPPGLHAGDDASGAGRPRPERKS